MSPHPDGKKFVIAQSKISLVSGGSVRNVVRVSSQCEPTMEMICMTSNLSDPTGISQFPISRFQGTRFALAAEFDIVRQRSPTRTRPAHSATGGTKLPKGESG